MERQNPYANPSVSSGNRDSLSEIMDSVNELESLYTDEYDFEVAYTTPELFRKQTVSPAPVSPTPAVSKTAPAAAPAVSASAPSAAVASVLQSASAAAAPAEAPVGTPVGDDPELFAKATQEPYADSGTYLNYDGSREFRSFDAAMPDVTDEGWYHYSDESAQDEDTGSYDDYDDYEDDDYYDEEEPPRHRGLKIFGKVVLAVLTFFSICYLTFIYSDNLYISRLRNMYINTAMTTLNHKYLATAIIPGDIIDELLIRQWESESIMQAGGSDWGNVNVGALPTLDQEVTDGTAEPDKAEDTASAEDSAADAESGPKYASEEERIFYEYFYELDYASASNYFKKNPQALANGWYYVDINEAGLSDSGTSILTTNGDQVLAINAHQGILLIRINIGSSRGVMAICKDPERLSLRAASTLGDVGQTAGKICEANDGILSITGSAFMDDGSGNGGQISGLAVCNGTTYGDRLGGTDKRLELRTDNKMYIVNSSDSVDPDTRDACEFRPALIMDGTITVDENCGWTSPNPRAVLGQTDKLEVMMVVVEGRFLDSPGCSVVKVAELMQDYGCVQALNLDGGTSAIMYYNGEYITRCSNTALPGGRTLPSAWVYLKK